MTGTNMITVNLGTMQTIVQHYFDTVLFKDGQSPLVKSVSWDSGYATGFKIETADKAKADHDA